MKKTAYIASVILLSSFAQGAVTQVSSQYTDNFQNGDGPAGISGPTGTLLPAGSLIEIGYFVGVDNSKDPATFTEAEWNSFQPLTGANSQNTDLNLAIGDGSSPVGLYTGSVDFDTNNPDADFFGGPGPLGLRFYNGSTVANSTHFNMVSSLQPNWDGIQAPATPSTVQPTLSLDYTGTGNTTPPNVAWRGTAYQTSIPLVPVPEPASTLLCALGSVALLRRKRSA